MSIHELIREKTELAKLYAEDGAFHSASRILRELAAAVQQHACELDDWETDPENIYGLASMQQSIEEDRK
ncbi:MAG: hypothetical protein RLO21_00805 [Nitratireductor sp.]